METSGGILARLGEKTLGWIILAGLVALGWAVYQMPAATKAAIWSGAWRTVFWVAIAAAIPWSARLFVRRLVAVGSNWAGIAAVGGFVAADVLAAMVLMTGWPAGGWSWFASLAALAVAGTYNYLVMEYLADQSGL